MFKRKPEERKVEAKKARIKYTDSSEFQDIRNKLGLKNTAPEDKIKQVLERLRSGNPKTWKAIGITSADFERFNIKDYDK